jgi:hypothetical protein
MTPDEISESDRMVSQCPCDRGEAFGINIPGDGGCGLSRALSERVNNAQAGEEHDGEVGTEEFDQSRAASYRIGKTSKLSAMGLLHLVAPETREVLSTCRWPQHLG